MYFSVFSQLFIFYCVNITYFIFYIYNSLFFYNILLRSEVTMKHSNENCEFFLNNVFYFCFQLYSVILLYLSTYFFNDEYISIGVRNERVPSTRANRFGLRILLRVDIGYSIHCDAVPSIRHVRPHFSQHQLGLVLLQEGKYYLQFSRLISSFTILIIIKYLSI